MSRQRVKDMSRKQQKAVFANLGTSGSSTISNSDRDKVLEREFPIKKGSRVKLRKDVLARHAKSVSAHLGYTKEQFAWRETLDKLEGKIGIVDRTFPDSQHINIRFGKTLIGIDKSEVIRNSNPYQEKPSKQNKNYKVVMVTPAVGTQKSEFISSEIMTKKQAEILAKEKKKLGWKRVAAIEVKKDMSYKQLKKAGIKLNPEADADSDGVKNSKDCKPFDKNKQGFFHKTKIDKSLDIRKKRLTFDEFKNSESAKTKLEAYHWGKKKWVSQDMKEKYTEFILKYHSDKPDTGDFLDKQLGYNKSGEQPVFGR